MEKRHWCGNGEQMYTYNFTSKTEDSSLFRSYSAFSFAGITASQKEVTASHAYAPSPNHGFDQCRALEVTAADRPREHTAVLRPCWVLLHRMPHRVFRAGGRSTQ